MCNSGTIFLTPKQKLLPEGFLTHLTTTHGYYFSCPQIVVIYSRNVLKYWRTQTTQTCICSLIPSWIVTGTVISERYMLLSVNIKAFTHPSELCRLNVVIFPRRKFCENVDNGDIFMIPMLSLYQCQYSVTFTWGKFKKITKLPPLENFSCVQYCLLFILHFNHFTIFQAELLERSWKAEPEEN